MTSNNYQAFDRTEALRGKWRSMATRASEEPMPAPCDNHRPSEAPVAVREKPPEVDVNEKLRTSLQKALKDGETKAESRKITTGLGKSFNKMFSAEDKPEGPEGKMTDDEQGVETMMPNE